MIELQRPVPRSVPSRHTPALQYRLGQPVPRERLDEQLLELILIDTLARRGKDRGIVADLLIEHLLPGRQYLLVIEHYDELSDDSDDESELMSVCFARASLKDSPWKTKMLRLFLHVVGAGRPITADDLAEVASFASDMGATIECEALFSTLYGMNPFA